MSTPYINDIDFIAAFKQLMEKRHIDSGVVAEFISLWRSLENSPRLPCPLCYAAGGWGELSAPEPRAGVLQATCFRCNTSIPIGTQKVERPRRSREPTGPGKVLPTGNVRWELIFTNGPDKGSWIWRLLRIDGSIEQMSEPKPDFGRAMRDAMKNGFKPSEDFWVIKRQNWITYFDRGRIAATGPNEQIISRGPERSGARGKATKAPSPGAMASKTSEQ
jgi:hypothetical protein